MFIFVRSWTADLWRRSKFLKTKKSFIEVSKNDSDSVIDLLLHKNHFFVNKLLNTFSLFQKEKQNKRSFPSNKVEFSHYICQRNPKTNWKTRRERTSTSSVHRNVKSFKENFSKKEFHWNSYKTLGPEESQKSWRSQRIKLNLHYKSKTQKSNTEHQKSKTLKTKICRGVDGVRKFTVKSTTKPYKGFRSQNEVCGPRCVRKSISKPTS